MVSYKVLRDPWNAGGGLIVTGEQTMFEYLFRPFLDAIRRSFREA
jgi:hypothetical protein